MINKKKILIIFALLLVAFIFLIIPPQNKNDNTVCFEDSCIYVGLATTTKEMTTGLMNRPSLPENMGMLFIFDHKSIYKLWMQNTLIPLDMIWLDDNGKIIYIERNAEPCYVSPCPSFGPESSSKYGLEVNGGYTERHKIRFGDKARINVNVEKSDQYPLHKNIVVTIFWVGEEGTYENGYIPNIQSAWDGNWKDNYGGIDDPHNRNGFYPQNFTPYENPFYFALPYNDFDENGNKKSSKNESIYKNRWIKIFKGNKIVYAQWEDVGPFEDDDIDYVFGNSKPKNKINGAGLDVSPAIRDYLGLEDVDIVDWQFVDFKDVPEGFWTEIITRSAISW